MAAGEHKIMFLPGSGLNYDDDYRIMGSDTGSGDGRERRNVRYGITGEGDTGAAKDIIGNKLINYTLPSGTNKVIGSCKDIEQDAIIYFVYNSDGNHCILRHFVLTDVIQGILVSQSILNFKADSIITHANVVNGKLYWTDGYFNSFEYDSEDNLDFNPPRSLNIQKAIGFTNGTPGFIAANTGYGLLNFEILDYIKYPPAFPPEAWYSSDTSVQLNNLRGYMFQFAGAYKYRDGEVSTLSPMSVVPMPLGQEQITGDYVNTYSYFNCIDVSIYAGSLDVDEIRLYARTSNTGDLYSIGYIDKKNYNGMTSFVADFNSGGNTLFNFSTVSSFNEIYVGMEISYQTSFPAGTHVTDINTDDMIVTVSNQASNTLINAPITVTGNAILKFYNNYIGDVLDSDYQSKLFDNVPQVCDCLEFISENRIVTGQITEGYDNVKIDISLEPGLLTKDALLGSEEIPVCWYRGSEPGTIINPLSTDYVSIWQFPISTTYVSPGNLYTLEISVPGFTETLTYTAQPTDTSFDVADGIATLFKALQPTYGGGAPYTWLFASSTTSITYAISYDDQKCFPIPPTVNVWLRLEIWGPAPGLTGAEGDMYFTYEATTSTYRSHKMGAYHNYGLVYFDGPNRSGNTNINDESKVYMPFYSYGTYNNLIGVIDWRINHKPPAWATHYQWVYTKNTSVQSFLQFKLDKAVVTTVHNKLEFDINSAITDLNDESQKSLVSTYVWQKGDHVRFIGKRTADNIELFNDYIDYEIIGQDATTGVFYTENFDYAAYGIDADTLVEVYTPRKDMENNIYYEVGEVYEIGNPHTPERYHRGNWTDQDFTVTPNIGATGRFTEGDVFVRKRYAPGFSFIVEDESFSDYYVSNVLNTGRINVVDRDAKRQTLPIVRWSGKYFQNTNINNLASFDFDDYTEFKQENGPITKLKDVGFTLKVVQKSKNSSVYVGRVSTAEAAGGGSTILAQSPLGTIMIPEQEYGTIHPASYIKYDRNAYFFDIYNGAVIRDSANGMFKISSYKMSSYFKNLCRSLLASGVDNINVIAAFDAAHGEYVLSITDDVNSDNDVTISFHEDDNRWKCFYDFYPEWMETSGQKLDSFIAGQLWKHHELVDINGNFVYNNFYGSQYDSEIDIVSNIAPDKIKTYMAMSAHTNNNKYDATNPTYAWEAYSIIIPPSEMYPSGMESRIRAARFDNKEGVLYAEFLGDMNTPGFATTQAALINGRRLYGEVIIIKMKHSSPEYVKLNNVTIKFVTSEYSY